MRGKIFLFDTFTKERREVDMRQLCGTVVLRAGNPDHVCVALMRGVALVDISGADGQVVKWLGNPEEEVAALCSSCSTLVAVDPLL